MRPQSKQGNPLSLSRPLCGRATRQTQQKPVRMNPTGFCYSSYTLNIYIVNSESIAIYHIFFTNRTIFVSRTAHDCSLFEHVQSVSCSALCFLRYSVRRRWNYMTIEEAFSKALKKARKEMGITQQLAAELCKLSVREFGNIERGTSKPGMDTIIQIYNVFGVSIYEFEAELPDKE